MKKLFFIISAINLIAGAVQAYGGDYCEGDALTAGQEYAHKKWNLVANTQEKAIAIIDKARITPKLKENPAPDESNIVPDTFEIKAGRMTIVLSTTRSQTDETICVLDKIISVNIHYSSSDYL